MGRLKLGFTYFVEEPNRHGTPRRYVRRNGKRIRITEDFDPTPGAKQSAAWTKAYAAALEATATPAPRKPTTERTTDSKPKAGTFGALATAYFDSGEFKSLDADSQRVRRGIITSCLKQTNKNEAMEHCPVDKLTAAKIRALRDAKRSTPGAANNRKKYLSAMFSWAVEGGHMAANPCRDVKKVRYATDGFHTWTVEEVRQYCEHHKVGSKARLALALLLFTGVRRSDVVRLGKPQENGDGTALRFVVRKTRWRKARVTEKPILPVLRLVLDSSPLGRFTYLETEHGRAFKSSNSFGNKMREWCDQAKLPHCSAHGLRKAGATIAAENGATVNQLMALYDWETAAQAIKYTQAADRKRLAASAAPLLMFAGA